MGLIYQSGFLVGGTNSMTCTIAGFTATITPGTYLAGNEDASAFIPSGGYTSFATALATAFDAAGGGPWTVTWSDTTGGYTISRGTNFTLSFSTDADLRLRAAIGMTGNRSGDNDYTSQEVPKYVLISAIGARSQMSNVYEPDGIVEEAVSDAGDAYGTALRTDELYSDWVQAFESKAATFTRDATVSHDWCWQAFFAHHRGTHPFGVLGPAGGDEETNPCYKLRAEGAFFRPTRVAADDDTYFSIPFRCRDLGLLSP